MHAGHAEHPANLLPALENMILMFPLPQVGQGPRSFFSVLLVHLGSTHCMDGGFPFLMTFSWGSPHTGQVVSMVCTRAPLGRGYARLQSGYPSHPMKFPFLDLLIVMLLPQVGHIPMCCCERRAVLIS